MKSSGDSPDETRTGLRGSRFLNWLEPHMRYKDGWCRFGHSHQPPAKPVLLSDRYSKTNSPRSREADRGCITDTKHVRLISRELSAAASDGYRTSDARDFPQRGTRSGPKSGVKSAVTAARSYA